MKEVLNLLNNTLLKNDIIVVGISGGPDSMCLIDILSSLKNKYNLTLICAHVNHNLRKESQKEALFVKNYCKEHSIIFEYYKINKYQNNKFTEKGGHEKRYEFFEKIVKKYHAQYLMTAHHGDDLIETILMKIVRGSNIKGYIGIPSLIIKKQYKILRPLIYLNKEEIISYLKEKNISYVIDKSNNNETYTRNRYRKNILPFLKKEDSKVNLKFLKFSQELEKYYNYIDEIITNKIKKLYDGKKINLELLNKEDIFIQEKIIIKTIEIIQEKNILNINDKQLNNIMKLLRSDNKQINLANGYIARKSYKYLYLEKEKETNSYLIEMNNNIVKYNNYQIEKVIKSNEKSNNIIRLNSQEIKLPLLIRNRKYGDKMFIKNLKGSKKIKDIFIDCKIDINQRKDYPVVVDSNDTILWIPGIKKSNFDKEINEMYDIILKYDGGKNE